MKRCAERAFSRMVFVESEAIDEIDHDNEPSTLFVRFSHSGWRRYFTVPSRVFQDFRAAESHGRFVHDHIRNR